MRLLVLPWGAAKGVDPRGPSPLLGGALGGLGWGSGQFLWSAGANVYAPRFLFFRHFAHQIDVQQPVFELGAGDDDMVRELEAALEAALGDAAVQVALAFFRFFLGA